MDNRACREDTMSALPAVIQGQKDVMPDESKLAQTQANESSSTMKATTWQGKQSISVLNKPKPQITEPVRELAVSKSKHALADILNACRRQM